MFKSDMMYNFGLIPIKQEDSLVAYDPPLSTPALSNEFNEYFSKVKFGVWLLRGVVRRIARDAWNAALIAKERKRLLELMR